MKCLKNPEKYLWTTTTKKFTQMRDIFYHIKSLQYEDKPSYSLIATKLREMQAIIMQEQYMSPLNYPMLTHPPNYYLMPPRPDNYMFQ